jgi:3-hydroxyacyl-CoA dehydrogenase/3a,7a,12a-trihydroxy-5b-cholest-24-enoyl-CoA hydratase
MSKELRYDGKVAIVTGAGGGLGRSHALLLASRGAKVVVNDLGGTFTGEGASQKAADTVVAEIRDKGGEAVANYDSVENGDAIAKTALDAFGKVDILINNAGILRDVSFQKMTQQDWDLVYKVHVLGSMKVSKAVWDVMREQQYGRIVMTASAAGIYGNFGQANYAMAKLGIFGFAQTLAHEGRKRNIFVNTIAPIAGSRMTETVLPPNLIEALAPEYVSPLVAWLCHEDNQDTGGLYEVGGGFFAKLRWERSTGKLFRVGRKITVEDVQSSWPAITQFDETTHPENIAASMQPIMENIEKGASKGGNQFIDVDEALGYEMPDAKTSYDERDVALYALAVGAAKDPTDDKDLQLVYEHHGSGMKVLPTFGVVPIIQVVFQMAKEGKQAPGLNYGFDRILHGEQYTEVLRPLPPKAKLTHKGRIKEIWDKGKGAVVVTEFRSYDESGEELIRNELTTFVRGAGGWGGDRGPSADVNVPPDRKPDAVVEERIPDNAALVYRLSGDWNPLHADPGFAKAFGFDKPILHGLCTFGYAGRQVVQAFAPDRHPGYFKSIKARFADTVYPGETLVTEMWKENDQRIVVRCKVKERDKVVISNAAVELYREIPKPKPKPATAQPSAGAGAQPAAAEPNSADIFRAIGRYVQENADLAAKVKTVYQFSLSDPASTWTVDVAGAPGVRKGAPEKAQCTLELSDADFMAMCTGKADAMKLFTSGKLKISGDIMASQKLEFLKKVPPEYVMEEAKKRGGGSAGASATGTGTAAAEAGSWDVFVAIRDHVERHPELVDRVKTIYQFKLTSPESVWTLNLADAPGSVDEGETKAPNCTLEIAEKDFMDMTSGKADAMKLFTTGKLKISGNVMASQKLDFLQKIDPNEAKAAVAKARGAGGPGAAGGGTAAAPVAAASKPKEASAPAVFAALEKRLAGKPDLADEVKAVIQVYVKDPDAKWKLDLANKPPAVALGETDSATTTLTLADADLAALVRGEATARELHQRGKLRIDGDISVAHRLGFLKGLI